VDEGCYSWGYGVSPSIVELMITVTRFYLPYVRIVKATEGLRGHPYLVSPLRGIIAYDANLPEDQRYAVLDRAIHQLWEQRHLAGLSEHDHVRPHLQAVS
jgi:hypothetical protein